MSRQPPAFDPDAAAAPGSGLFGLACTEDEAEVLVLPVPFDATTSYRPGTADGPAAILAASHQVDLYDLQCGRAWQRGIHLLPEPRGVREANNRCRRLAAPIVAAGGATADDQEALAEIERAMAAMHAEVCARTAATLAAGKVPGVLGGDHSVPQGAIAAAATAAAPLGILHIDAHADLRDAYEGFRYSHASIMHNVLREVDGVERLVQVGVRDFGEQEMAAIRAGGGRVVTWFDLELRRRLADGEALSALLDEILAPLPERVWVSFDIDGLDPSLCPSTGTPVPGGLSFAEVCLLLERLVLRGRQVVGFDLVEVAPGSGGDEWDANVGARVLYKLCGFALRSRHGADGGRPVSDAD